MPILEVSLNALDDTLQHAKTASQESFRDQLSTL